MSLNTSHLHGGVLIHNGEVILLYSDHTTLECIGHDAAALKGIHHGRFYLTTHRVIFISDNSKDPMQSFSMPFMALSDVELQQPIFGANYIKGKARAQPNGNWVGEVKFKCVFKHGGAIDFGQAMMKAARLASHVGGGGGGSGGGGQYPYELPPPPPSHEWYQAPPPAYSPPPQGYYGWVPPTHVFPNHPPANSVYMTDAPPPYPGINGAGYVGQAAPMMPQPRMGTKAAEAAQAAYYDPSRPQMAYVPPPPSYDEAARDKKHE